MELGIPGIFVAVAAILILLLIGGIVTAVYFYLRDRD